MTLDPAGTLWQSSRSESRERQSLAVDLRSHRAESFSGEGGEGLQENQCRGSPGRATVDGAFYMKNSGLK